MVLFDKDIDIQLSKMEAYKAPVVSRRITKKTT